MTTDVDSSKSKLLAVDTRRPCSDSRHVTAPYKLSFLLLLLLLLAAAAPNLSDSDRLA